jgi:drug/metabolite transporter (DMT)-like permease
LNGSARPQGNLQPLQEAIHIHQPGKDLFMNATKIAGILLIVIGLAGFFTGGFSFTKDSTAAKIGPLELTVKEKESVNIPQWLSIGAVVLGAVLLGAGFKRS